MLFVFPEEDQRSFWMKNVRIDLDIIFLSSDRHIQFLAEAVPHSNPDTPDEYLARVEGNAQYALELASGSISRYGLVIGQEVTFDLPARLHAEE